MQLLDAANFCPAPAVREVACGLQSLCITETVFDAKDTAINREVVSCGLQLVKNTIHFSYFFKYVEIS